MLISKGNKEVFFGTQVKMGASRLLGAKSKFSEDFAGVISERKEMSLERFHCMLGHPSIQATKETAQRIGLKLTGKLGECKNFMLAKMRKKSISKVVANVSKVAGERLLLDISYIKQVSIGQRNIWILIEDQFSKIKWSIFKRRKNEMVGEVAEFIKKLKVKSPESARFLRMDNAKENVYLKARLEKEGVDITIELSSPNTPQQNGQVERSFATLWGRVRSMLNDSGVPDELRSKLWAECAFTATKLCNITSKNGSSSPYKRFYVW